MADAPTESQVNARGRQQLARMVVIGSFLTIFLLVATLLSIAQLSENTKAADLAEKTFNAILPVLASWVGTVLAFYFSAASLERASASLDKAISAASGAGADSKTAAEVMIPLGKIKELVDLDVTPSLPTLEVLQNKFTGALATALPAGAKPPDGPAVTRLVFVNTNVFRYVLHFATLNAYLAKPGTAKTDTFDTFRSDPEVLQQISRMVVFVAASATLKDAKAALDRVSGAQDIIVTATGNSSDPMLGWITNVDLIKVLTGP
jgi:hypothetical protein